MNTVEKVGAILLFIIFAVILTFFGFFVYAVIECGICSVMGGV